MKTVIIPNDYHPFVIEVNGVKYTYPEGTEQSVPDEVASAIEHYYKLQPQEKPTDGGVLPYVSGENEGEVLTVKDGAWTTEESKGGEPFVVTIQNNKSDKRAAKILSAWQNHERIVVTRIIGSLATYYEIFNVRVPVSAVVLSGFTITAEGLALATITILGDDLSGFSTGLVKGLPDAQDLEAQKTYRLRLKKSSESTYLYYWEEVSEKVMTVADDAATTLITLVEGFLSTLGTDAGDEGQLSQSFPFAYAALLSGAQESLAVHGRVVFVVGDTETTLLSNNVESNTAMFSFSYIYSSHTYLVDMIVNSDAIILHARCLA